MYRLPIFAQVASVLITFALQSQIQADPPKFLFGTPQRVPGIDSNAYKPSLTADGLEMYFFENQRDRLNRRLLVAKRSSITDPFGPEQRLNEINTSGYSTFLPEISHDGLTLYFSRRIASSDAKSVVLSATRSSRSEPFGNLTEHLNAGTHDLYVNSVSSDGLKMYLTYDADSTLDEQLDLYQASRATIKDKWSQPVPLQPFAEPASGEFRPGISNDGRALFITETGRGRSDGRSWRDIYVSVRDQISDPWRPSVNLGSIINTDRIEWDPFMSRDGSTLYFVRADEEASVDDGEIWQAPILPFDSIPLSGQTGTYSQDFSTLGTDGTAVGTALPPGWTFTGNDVVFNNTITGNFPFGRRSWSQVYNVGVGGAEDRALATDVTKTEAGEIDFRVLIKESPAQALRLGFDMEAWRLVTDGEPTFHLVLEADRGKGFEQLADLGEFSTGATLIRPETGNTVVDGNDPAYRRSLDTGPIDTADLPVDSILRVRWIGTQKAGSISFGLDNVSLRFATLGDADIDGQVTFNDFLLLSHHFGQSGDWGAGDFDNNGQVEFADFTILSSHFGERTAVASSSASTSISVVPEPSGFSLYLAMSGFVLRVSRKVSRPERTNQLD